MPNEWGVARLVLLPKNGDLSLSKNWRGILQLDIASKVFSSMCVRRLKIVEGVHRVADLVATRLASKHLDYVRTSKSIAKAMRTQRICRAWGHSFARGFARVILDRLRDNLDQAPGSRNWGSELDADAEFNFFYPPTSGRGRS
jgi:hypothetical protein